MKTLRTATVVALVSAASLVSSVGYAQEGLRRPTGTSPRAGPQNSRPVSRSERTAGLSSSTRCARHSARPAARRARSNTTATPAPPIWTYRRRRRRTLTLLPKLPESPSAPTAIRSWPSPSAMRRHELRHRRRQAQWHDRRANLAAEHLRRNDVRLRQGRRPSAPDGHPVVAGATCRRRKQQLPGQSDQVQRRDRRDHLERERAEPTTRCSSASQWSPVRPSSNNVIVTGVAVRRDDTELQLRHDAAERRDRRAGCDDAYNAGEPLNYFSELGWGVRIGTDAFRW